MVRLHHLFLSIEVMKNTSFHLFLTIYISLLLFLPRQLIFCHRLRTRTRNKEKKNELESTREYTTDLKTVNLLMTIHEAVSKEGGNQSVLDHTIHVTYKLLPVERVHIIMIARDADDKLMTSDCFQYEADLSRGVAASVATTGRTACINEAEQDSKSLRPGEKPKIPFKNLICAAIKSSTGEVIGVITAFDKSDKNDSRSVPFNHCDECLLEIIATNMGVALNKAAVYEQTSREKRRYSALVPVLRARSCEKPLNEILRKTVDVVCQLLNSELVSIYLVDHATQEAVICASKDGLEGYTVSFGQGIAGTVAKNGKVVRIVDAYNDSRFDPNVDNCTGVITKTMMCVPVPGFNEETVAAAVIQAINKTAGNNFDSFDEESLVLLSTELSNVLRSKAIELHELRSLTSSNGTGRKYNSDMELQQSLLREYGSKRYKAPYLLRCISRTESFRARRNTLGSSGLIKLHGLDTNAVDMMSEETVRAYLSCHDTDPFLLDDMTLIYLAKHMLDNYGLIERFQLNLDRLRHFLIAVHKMYHKNNSFHNFKHAWGTMHLVYQILSHGADDYLTSLDILAVLLAAICHDLDHPGNNNAFEVATRSTLAVTYSDDTVLERHHCSSALKLLSAAENDFLENLTPSEKIKLRKIITTSIMATDMSQHFLLVEQLVFHGARHVPFSKKDSEERIILTRLVLHCADIGAQTQKRELALKWTERCLDEFAAQGAKEIELGLELTPFMQGLDLELTRMQLQVGFVGGIVVPLWSALAGCFHDLEFAASQALNNKIHYADQVSSLLEVRLPTN